MKEAPQKPGSYKVLIVTDSKDEKENVQQLLGSEFGSLLATEISSEGLQLLIKFKPTILILAFASVIKAKKFYLALYQQNKQISATPHQTLLLCKGSESEEAYQLYKRGMVDDYVADRPMYDPFRLRLSVAQALNRRNAASNNSWLNHQVNKVTQGLFQLNQLVNNKMQTGVNYQNESVNLFESFTHDLAKDLKQLEQNISLLSSESGDPINQQELGKHFKAFNTNTLQAGSKQVLDSLKKSQGELKTINTEYRNAATNMKQAQEKKPVIEVMIVEDDDMYREMVTTMLESGGMHAMGVADGNSAINNLQFRKPDVILMDYMMPGIDGISLLKQIKGNSELKHIPVIMLTGEKSREVIGKSVSAGASKFIVKPSDRKTIIATINSVLQATPPAKA